jgi:transcriptional regulator with XRE-family HTH domain
MKGAKHKTRNGLWAARQRAGYGQKAVAYLLGHRTTDQVTRYEKGSRLPSLKLLLELEIIYGVPPRLLYPEYYEELRQRVERRAGRLKTLGRPPAPQAAEVPAAYCAQEELLRAASLTDAERERVRDHVVALMRRLNEL